MNVGSGVHSTIFPGCAETFETESSLDRRAQSGDRGQRSLDRHQKVRRFRAGDILALPAGVTHWTYNDGEEPIISVSLIDTSNVANQLDLTFRVIKKNPTFLNKDSFFVLQHDFTSLCSFNTVA